MGKALSITRRLGKVALVALSLHVLGGTALANTTPEAQALARQFEVHFFITGWRERSATPDGRPEDNLDAITVIRYLGTEPITVEANTCGALVMDQSLLINARDSLGNRVACLDISSPRTMQPGESLVITSNFYFPEWPHNRQLLKAVGLTVYPDHAVSRTGRSVRLTLVPLGRSGD